MVKVHQFPYKGHNYSIRMLDDGSLNVMRGTNKFFNINRDFEIELGDLAHEMIADELWKFIKEIWIFVTELFSKRL